MNEGRVIISVAHIDQILYSGLLGTFVVPGRGEPNDEVRPYGKLVIPEELNEGVDKGWSDTTETGRFLHRHDGRKFAKSILESYQTSIGDRADLRINLGLLLIAGDEPTQAELARATKEYHAALELFFNAGRVAWNRHRNIRAINDISKLAVKVLGRECEWAEGGPNVRRIPCPNCAELIPTTLAIHRRTQNGDECGYILDTEKVKRLYPEEPGQKVRRLLKTEAVPGAGL